MTQERNEEREATERKAIGFQSPFSVTCDRRRSALFAPPNLISSFFVSTRTEAKAAGTLLMRTGHVCNLVLNRPMKVKKGVHVGFFGEI